MHYFHNILLSVALEKCFMHYVFRPSVRCPSTIISRDAIFLYLVEGFQ